MVVLTYNVKYIHTCRRIVNEMQERSKQGHTNNKAKQHSTNCVRLWEYDLWLGWLAHLEEGSSCVQVRPDEGL